MTTIPSTDHEYEDYRITKVDGAGESGWSITHERGWSFWVPAEHGVEPKVGQVARFYGRGIGYIVRGLTLNGHVVFYRTDKEQRAHDRQMAEESDARRRREFEEKRTEYEQAVEALPLPLCIRFARFRGNNPEFDWQFGPYELFGCEEAVRIRALGSAEAIAAFHVASSEEQRALVPKVRMDEHSGNTFGFACSMARLLLTDEARASAQHGALCPLVGCKEYGCFAVPQAVTP